MEIASVLQAVTIKPLMFWPLYFETSCTLSRNVVHALKLKTRQTKLKSRIYESVLLVFKKGAGYCEMVQGSL